MKCKERKYGKAVVVDIDGKLVGGPGSEGFHGLIKQLLEDGEKRFVVNLRDTPWANSQGIGLLIGALTSVSNAGGRLVLADACERIHDILNVTRLSMIFECFESVEEATRHVLSTSGGGAARIVAMRAFTPA